MEWLIYCHRNKINGKCYVGQTHFTKNPNIRWRDGLGYLDGHHKNIFEKAIKKYGWNNFDHLILEEHIKTSKEANSREIYWIAKMHSYCKDPLGYGYNADKGGKNHLGRFISDEQREKYRLNKLGTKASAETKAKMSKTRKGRKYIPSEKQKNNLDNLHTMRRGYKYNLEDKKEHSKNQLKINQNKRYSLTAEEKQKELERLSKAKKCRPIMCIELNMTFRTIKSAGIYFNIARTAISQALGKRHSCAAGYTWRYLTEEEIKEYFK